MGSEGTTHKEKTRCSQIFHVGWVLAQLAIGLSGHADVQLVGLPPVDVPLQVAQDGVQVLNQLANRRL